MFQIYFDVFNIFYLYIDILKFSNWTRWKKRVVNMFFVMINGINDPQIIIKDKTKFLFLSIVVHQKIVHGCSIFFLTTQTKREFVVAFNQHTVTHSTNWSDSEVNG